MTRPRNGQPSATPTQVPAAMSTKPPKTSSEARSSPPTLPSSLAEDAGLAVFKDSRTAPTTATTLRERHRIGPETGTAKWTHATAAFGNAPPIAGVQDIGGPRTRRQSASFVTSTTEMASQAPWSGSTKRTRTRGALASGAGTPLQHGTRGDSASLGPGSESSALSARGRHRDSSSGFESAGSSRSPQRHTGAASRLTSSLEKGKIIDNMPGTNAARATRLEKLGKRELVQIFGPLEEFVALAPAPSTGMKGKAAAREPESEESEESAESDDVWEEIEPTSFGSEETQQAVGDKDGSSAARSSTNLDEYKTIEITFKAPKVKSSKTSGVSKLQKFICEQTHMTHLLCLLSNAMTRNRWCNDPEVLAAALSIVPERLRKRFYTTDQSDHGKTGATMEIRSIVLRDLAAWWHDYFDVTGPGILNGIWVSEPWKRLQKAEKAVNPLSIIDSPLALIDRLNSRMSDRDVSAQLFVVVCRSLGMETRLVTSLQAITFRAKSMMCESENKLSGDDETDRAQKPCPEDRDLDAREVLVAWPSTATLRGVRNSGTDGATISSRKRRRTATRSEVETLGVAVGESENENNEEGGGGDGSAQHRKRAGGVDQAGTSRKKRRLPAEDPGPPVFWAEVWSPQEDKWLCVDAVGGRKGTLWRSVGDEMKKALLPDERGVGNVLAYVVACEQDGSIKDVTRRYAQQYGAKTKRLRLPVAKNRTDWWEDTIAPFVSRDQSPRSEKEDNELAAAENAEAMPKTIAEFNNHPLYALERHLKKFEVLGSNAPVLGTVRGEKVYPRSSVHQCHTVETWLKEGRSVKSEEEPLKYVKSRAVTINTKRAVNLSELREVPDVGVYAEWQTEVFVPPSVVDGKVPKNSYNRVDLFQPWMVPKGAAHIPINGIAKIARKLGVDYAEAVVGFEFQARRCVPTVNGIVVPEESEHYIREAYREMEEERQKKEYEKLQKRAQEERRREAKKKEIEQRLAERYGTKDTSEYEQLAPSGRGEMETFGGAIYSRQDSEKGPAIFNGLAGGFLHGPNPEQRNIDVSAIESARASDRTEMQMSQSPASSGSLSPPASPVVKNPRSFAAAARCGTGKQTTLRVVNAPSSMRPPVSDDSDLRMRGAATAARTGRKKVTRGRGAARSRGETDTEDESSLSSLCSDDTSSGSESVPGLGEDSSGSSNSDLSDDDFQRPQPHVAVAPSSSRPKRAAAIRSALRTKAIAERHE